VCGGAPRPRPAGAPGWSRRGAGRAVARGASARGRRSSRIEVECDEPRECRGLRVATRESRASETRERDPPTPQTRDRQGRTDATLSRALASRDARLSARPRAYFTAYHHPLTGLRGPGSMTGSRVWVLGPGSAVSAVARLVGCRLSRSVRWEILHVSDSSALYHSLSRVPVRSPLQC
jgi:hypothetical protein